jgi:broad specificity phosphatase PhoE
VKSEEYDQLSELGLEQSALLGVHLTASIATPQCLCIGPRRRHRQTWEASAVGADGWPTPTFHHALDELPAESVMRLGLPIVAQTGHPAVALFPKLQAGGLSSLEVDEIIQLFDVALSLWMDGVVSDPELESWPGFQHRVKQTLEGLAAHARDQKPAVAITSAGFIATAYGLINGLSAENVRSLIWRVPNCSLTVLRRGGSIADWSVIEETSDTFLPEEERTYI